ncbi:hypothetical protein [Anaerostipes sp.]|nr:hypothetical protein [Anaerostipes sp.]
MMKLSKYQRSIQLFLYQHPCVNRWISRFCASMEEARRCLCREE